MATAPVFMGAAGLLVAELTAEPALLEREATAELAPLVIESMAEEMEALSEPVAVESWDWREEREPPAALVTEAAAESRLELMLLTAEPTEEAAEAAAEVWEEATEPALLAMELRAEVTAPEAEAGMLVWACFLKWLATVDGIEVCRSRGTYKSHRSEDSEDGRELHFDGCLGLLLLLVVIIVGCMVLSERCSWVFRRGKM